MNIPEKRMRESLIYAEMAGFTLDEIDNLQKKIDVIASSDEYTACYLEAYGAYIAPEHYENAGKTLECDKMVPEGAAFNLIVLLSLVPRMKELYAKNGYTDSMFRAGLRDLKIWFDHTRDNYGVFGIEKFGSGFMWIMYQIHGEVLRFGRLQCNIASSFYDDFEIYRNKSTSEITAMLVKKCKINSLGLFALENEAVAFETVPLEKTSDIVRGYAVSSDGFVRNNVKTLELSGWECVLKGGDFAINLHIPADGPMLYSDCEKSITEMVSFFRTYRNIDPAACICESWLLDPQLPSILPETSNIVDFERHVYLLSAHGVSDAIRRVFGVKASKEGVDAVPHKSSMQKRMAQFVHNGGVFRAGAMVLMLKN